ncbi:unnamed protein product [Parnassius mnemosyne]|uniref:Regulatory protein zeste n=1 Tax=Parnassius mnemosyne TaxID=213953 RepID=A0AAV1LUW8_9NEOP
MNPVERAAHPSTAQIHALLNFLEMNPSLAKGFSKVPSARDTARKSWEKLALQLNSLGGCVKTWKQWTKYWADKKSAVKKKGALRFRTRNKTGGGKEVVELSEIEEKILALMGGESFATGDRHLEINPFFEAQAGKSLENSPSLLASTQLIGLNPLPLPMEQQTQHKHTTPSSIGDFPAGNVPVVETTQQHAIERQAILCLPGTSGPSSRPSVVRMVSLSPLPMVVQSPPCTPPTVGGPASPPPTPSGSGSHPHRLRNARRQLIRSPVHNHPLLNTTTSRLRHNRRSRASPPSQRRSQFTSFSERFLAIEEQKLEINRRNSELLEMLVNQTVQSIGEGLKLLQETLKK